jgi:hypothetical protein
MEVIEFPPENEVVRSTRRKETTSKDGSGEATGSWAAPNPTNNILATIPRQKSFLNMKTAFSIQKFLLSTAC